MIRAYKCTCHNVYSASWDDRIISSFVESGRCTKLLQVRGSMECLIPISACRQACGGEDLKGVVV